MTTRRECLPCNGIEARTPESVANRPGLPALRYRVGRHGTILETMQARLSEMYSRREAESRRAGGTPECSRPASLDAAPAAPWLHTRELNDPSIALLDAWATVGDVLTFYQERIANEGYLGTALERRSLTELARHVGYELRPALSASVYLAFDVQAPPSLDSDVKIPPPHEVKISKGTQAKSIPLPGELPAIFETTEDLIARPEWNVLKPRMFRPTAINASTVHEIDRLRIERQGHLLQPGDMLLVETSADSQGGRIGVPRQIVTVTPEPPQVGVEVDGSKSYLEVKLTDSPFSQRAYLLSLRKTSQEFLNATNAFAPKDDQSSGHLGALRQKAESLVHRSLLQRSADESETLASLDASVWGSLQSVNEHIAGLELLAFFKSWREGAAQFSENYRDSMIGDFRHSLWDTGARFRKSMDALLQAIDNLKHLFSLSALKRIVDIVAPLHLAVQAASPFANLLSVILIEAEAIPVEIGRQEKPPFKALFKHLDRARNELVDGDENMSLFLTEIQEQPSLDAVFSFLAEWKTLSRQNWFTDHFARSLDREVQNAKSHAVLAARVRGYKIAGDEPSENTSREFAAKVKRLKRLVSEYERKIYFEGNFDLLLHHLNENAVIWFLDENVVFAEKLKTAVTGFRNGLKAPGIAVGRGAIALLQKSSQLSPNRSQWESRLRELGRVVEDWDKEAEKHNGLLLALRDLLVKIQEGDGASQADVMNIQVNHLKAIFDRTLARSQVTPVAASVTFETGQVFDIEDRRQSQQGRGRIETAEGKSALIAQMLTRMRPEQGRQMMTFLREARSAGPGGRVFSFRHRAGLFGRLAVPALDLDEANDEHLVLKVAPTAPEQPDEIFLDNEYSEVVAAGRCLVSSKIATRQEGELTNSEPIGAVLQTELHVPLEILDATIVHRASRGQCGKSTRLWLRDPWRTGSVNPGEELLQSTVVHVGSLELPLAEERIDDLFPAGFDKGEAQQSELELSGFVGELRTGATILITGEYVHLQNGVPRTTGVTVTRIRRVVAIIDSGTQDDRSKRPYATVIVDSALDVRMKRDTVRIYANVVEATHGETQTEIVGSGEGVGEFQEFVLSRVGLTHLPRETPTGMAPALALRVNAIEWTRGERPDDLQALSDGRLPTRYLVRVNDDGRSILRTGDGKTLGERLPTGVANVVVEYRVGGGRAGNVREGAVTQLPSPPLNVTKVRNLRAASGGVDREGVKQARTGIPIAATSLDRLVSLADYESFARRFGGIAKAQATFLTLQGRTTVVVTVATLDDAPLEQDSLLFRNLNGALRRYSDPDQDIVLLHREQMLLMLRGRVRIDPLYFWDSVRSEILGRLVGRFSFENAKLAEDVLLSDVIAEIQAVEGVRYVDIDAFDRMRQFYENADMIVKEASFAATVTPMSAVEVSGAQERAPDIGKIIVDVGKDSIEQAFLKRLPATVLRERISNYGAIKHETGRQSLEFRFVPAAAEGVPPDNQPCFPAQIAYFTNLPGTIDLEEIKKP